MASLREYLDQTGISCGDGGSMTEPNPSSRRAIGQAIRQARGARGLSQKELAAESGVEHVWISNLETGKLRRPSLETLARICAVLRIDREKFQRAIEAAEAGASVRVVSEVRIEIEGRA